MDTFTRSAFGHSNKMTKGKCSVLYNKWGVNSDTACVCLMSVFVEPTEMVVCAYASVHCVV